MTFYNLTLNYFLVLFLTGSACLPCCALQLNTFSISLAVRIGHTSESQNISCEWKGWGPLLGLAHKNFHLQTFYPKDLEEEQTASGKDPGFPSHSVEHSHLQPLLAHFTLLASDMSKK